jgi:hypothetical protein
VTFGFLRSVPGIGPILGLILPYEIDQIARFPEVGNFLSYSRLVRCDRSVCWAGSDHNVRGRNRLRSQQTRPRRSCVRGRIT